jgi:heme A synthase
MTENIATVQFNHRNLAYSTLVAAGAVMVAARRVGMKELPPSVRKAVHSLTGMAGTQAALGISTLMLYVQPLCTRGWVESACARLCLWIWVRVFHRP